MTTQPVKTTPDIKWWQQSVVYQIYPRSFMDSNKDGIGDLPGIISRLDYLKRLGTDVLWLCPIYASPNIDNGYDISNYRHIMPEYGTMDDFRLLLQKAHQKGLRIILDMVVNHTSDEHDWFIKSKSGDKPYCDYYIWRDGQNNGPPNNWRSNFGGSAWTYDETRKMYYLHLFHEKQPELNWSCRSLRREIYDLMNWWLEKGVDGFRLDVINHIGKNQSFPSGLIGPDGLGDFVPYAVNQDISHQYLREMKEAVFPNYDIMTVGETPFANTDDAVKYAGINGEELNMIFQFEHMDLDNAADGSKWSDRKIALSALKSSLGSWQKQLSGKAWNSLYWGNHDQPRPVSRLGNDKNPVLWDKSAKMLATCLHMMQGTPFIYQGEELGMTNYPFDCIDQFHDVESINAYRDYTQRGVSSTTMLSYLRNKSRDNARSPMQWNDNVNAGFSDGTPWFAVNPNYKLINAAAQINDPDSIFHYYRQLIELRKQLPLLTLGTFEMYRPEHPQIFSFYRKYQNDVIWVACNYAERENTILLPEFISASAASILCTNYDRRPAGELEAEITLQPYEALVLSVTESTAITAP